MNQFLRTVSLVVTTIWVGGLIWIGLVFAPYLFGLAANNSATVPNTGVAAELIGPLLYGSDVVGLIAVASIGSMLLILRFRHCVSMGGRFYLCEILLVFAAICASVNYFGFTPALNQVQSQLRESYGGFHLADHSDPLYAQFTYLHQTSTAIFLMGLAVAFVVLICHSRFRDLSANTQIAT